ncbi:hypothetical protein [Pseudoalteromonas denitrificans]|uniref:Uncharacterized protein n=1 Tax=Pseudoalteromonas denitrificans DSM 6059 TaxID=1123010 RepID=A0A1I1HP94_9GAMM|nr:hypothetical protein [Pseudoalteromonas denitrificans]SFC25927.1 hypothetical protein SAMN02745724_01290 [Pseudoalteromonas denitrificans DSM 6059]
MFKRQNAYLLLSFTGFFLQGCQNTRQTTLDSELKLELIQTQWQSMAQSAAKVYRDAGFILTAELKWQDEQWGKKYYFDDISLTEPVSEYRIDLLNPDFTNKFLCSWYCERIDETKYDKLIGYYSHLTFFYQNLKPELLTFYSNLIEIEDNLSNVNYSAEDLKIKLYKIKQDPPSFSNFTEFDEYLTRQVFEKNGYFEPSNQIDNTLALFNDNNNSAIDSVNDTDIVEVSTLSTDNYNALPHIPVKSIPLKIDDTVCSYQENFFGKVLELQTNGNKVLLSVSGQAKRQQEGAIIDLIPGYLITQGGHFEYLELDEIKVFNIDDVSHCEMAI